MVMRLVPIFFNTKTTQTITKEFKENFTRRLSWFEVKHDQIALLMGEKSTVKHYRVPKDLKTLKTLSHTVRHCPKILKKKSHCCCFANTSCNLPKKHLMYNFSWTVLEIDRIAILFKKKILWFIHFKWPRQIGFYLMPCLIVNIIMFKYYMVLHLIELQKTHSVI